MKAHSDPYIFVHNITREITEVKAKSTGQAVATFIRDFERRAGRPLAPLEVDALLASTKMVDEKDIPHPIMGFL